MIPQNSLPPKAWTQYQGHRPTIGTNACFSTVAKEGQRTACFIWSMHLPAGRSLMRLWCAVLCMELFVR
jgi:hypothetical protein